MLPSTGLFKTVNCPYYEKESCIRPYCHFKHAKKEEEVKPVVKPQPAVYNPTPKCILDAQKIPAEIINKKPKQKLEYVPKPTKQTNGQAPYNPNIPVYIPSTLPANYSVESNLNLDNCNEELDLIDEIVNSENVNSETKILEYTPTKIQNNNLNNDGTTIKSEANGELEMSIKINKEAENDNIKNNSKNVIVDSKQEKIEERRKSSSKSSSHKSSSHSRDKSKTNSNSKSHDNEKISSEKRRESTSSKDSSKHTSERKQSRSSKSSKSSDSKSSHNHKHSKHSKSSSSSKSSSFREKSSSRHSSSNSKSNNSSSRSSSHKSKSNSTKEEKHKIKDDNKDEEDNASNNADLSDGEPMYDSESDEDEILNQCKMIFEEFNSSNVDKITEDNNKDEENVSNNLRAIDMFSMENYEKSKKKRVAHETLSSNFKKLCNNEEPPKKNHVKNAMHSIYIRQELVRKQLEEQAKKTEAAEAAAAALMEQQYNALLAANGKTSSSSSKVTTATATATTSSLTSSSNYTTTLIKPARTMIAPVSNALALQQAIKKVEQLKMTKQHQPFAGNQTLAQSASKMAAKRIAHINPAVIKNDKPSPPVLEPESTKISYNLRMQYYNMMVKHCLIIYPNCEDAWDRAQTEELAVMKKCSTAVIYKSSSLLAINKLRKESIEAGNVGTDRNNTISHDVILAGKLGQKTSWSVNKKLKLDTTASSCNLDKMSSEKAYELIYECILTEEQLKENGYPIAGDGRGKAIINKALKLKPRNESERYCARCTKLFNLDEYDDYNIVDQCNYHPKRTGFQRGSSDNLHRCCQSPAGTPGCTYGNYHVTDYLDFNNLNGFVKTIKRDSKYVPTRDDIFALDCEMCYTKNGLELTRITVVNYNLKIVYDALVKPDDRIVDYNTVFSGISESTLANVKRTLRDVQAVLLSMFHSKTILVGHSLESDLKALKLIHGVVVDTSILFPHKMGPTKKRALKTLCIENLKRIIQENEGGHDSAEDAEVCIQLVKYYLSNRIV